MSVKSLKKLRLLNSYFQEDPARIYKATVTRIKSFGLSFEIDQLMLEGFLHISELGSDYFLYDETRGALYGRHTGMTYTVGKMIEVRLLAVNFISQESQWEIGTGSRKKSSHPRREPGRERRKGGRRR
jgi:ribonuclease R